MVCGGGWTVLPPQLHPPPTPLTHTHRHTGFNQWAEDTLLTFCHFIYHNQSQDRPSVHPPIYSSCCPQRSTLASGRGPAMVAEVLHGGSVDQHGRKNRISYTHTQRLTRSPCTQSLVRHGVQARANAYDLLQMNNSHRATINGAACMTGAAATAPTLLFIYLFILGGCIPQQRH